MQDKCGSPDASEEAVRLIMEQVKQMCENKRIFPMRLLL